jgi:hypothetical protein
MLAVAVGNPLDFVCRDLHQSDRRSASRIGLFKGSFDTSSDNAKGIGSSKFLFDRWLIVCGGGIKRHAVLGDVLVMGGDLAGRGHHKEYHSEFNHPAFGSHNIDREHGSAGSVLRISHRIVQFTLGHHDVDTKLECAGIKSVVGCGKPVADSESVLFCFFGNRASRDINSIFWSREPCRTLR